MNNNIKNISIYEIFNDKYINPNSKIIKLLHAGKVIDVKKNNIIYDDIKDNISYKNKNLSELTGIYYI